MVRTHHLPPVTTRSTSRSARVIRNLAQRRCQPEQAVGKPLAIADSDGMPTTRPGRRTPTPPASRGIRARASLATAHRLLSWRTDPCAALLATRFATRRAAVMPDRGNMTSMGQAVGAPGARRPAIAQDLLPPLTGDDQRVPAGQRRPRSATARVRTESTAMDPERLLSVKSRGRIAVVLPAVWCRGWLRWRSTIGRLGGPG